MLKGKFIWFNSLTMLKKFLSLLIVLTAHINASYAWVYPEHRNISLTAIQYLDPAKRARLDQLWALARVGHTSRLCVMAADSGQREHPGCIDFAAWAAIAGDHSTSPVNLLHNILETGWIMNVADIAARLETGLKEADNRSEIVARLRDSDLRLLRADPEYVSRAGVNNGHFMLARPDVNTPSVDYFHKCFREGTPLTLIGIYKWFLASAMLKASRLANESLTPEQRSALALALLADEAFALHFLNDGFSSGHVAGIWGDASLRKGTHDYYDEKGLEVTNWNGERFILMGDAYMRPVDADRAARAVVVSLEQLLDATQGLKGPFPVNDQAGQFTADTFNVSKAVTMPGRILDPGVEGLFFNILATTAVPGLASGLGEIPRFRSEIGPFLGLAASVRGSVISSGFEVSQKTSGFVPGMGIAIRIGLGMEGVLNESSDGLAFIDLGWRLDGASSMKYFNEPSLKYFGSILSAIPSRDGYFARIRLPFYLIPGDLLILAPILLLTSPESVSKVLVTAANGGLIPWQSGIMTPLGRFQFMLGREIEICFWGGDKGGDVMLVTNSNDNYEDALIEMYSIQLDFPVFEYRPFRTFSSSQGADLVFQVNAGMDIPWKTKVIYPETGPAPELKTTWFIGIRLAFDWRYYFKNKKS